MVYLPLNILFQTHGFPPIRALCVIEDHQFKDTRKNKGIKAIKDVKGVNNEAYSLTLFTAAIAEILMKLAEEEELDIDVDAITSRHVGHFLGKMRFINDRTSGHHIRQGKVRISDLAKRARFYGLEIPESICYQGGLNLNALNALNVLNALTL